MKPERVLGDVHDLSEPLRGKPLSDGRGPSRTCARALAGMLLALLLSAPSPVHAQTGEGWSRPEVIFTSPDKVWLPLIVAGRDGTAHLFYVDKAPSDADSVRRDEVIYYQSWDGKKWTDPIDIFVFPAVELSSAAIDRNGSLHLLWWGSAGRLFYSRAFSGEAHSARAWSRPVPVAEAQPHGQIFADPTGRLHRVYGGLDERGPYYQFSTDGGETWSQPINVARTSDTGVAADYVRMAVDSKGTIHLVWTEWELPSGWPPTGVFYSRSMDFGQSWSNPVELAGAGFDQANIAASSMGVVHVAWNGMAGVGGRYDRWSADGGESWSAAAMVSPRGGTEGPPQLAVDTRGEVHLFTTFQERAWYASWWNGAWSGLSHVPSGDEVGLPPVGTDMTEAVRWTEQAAMTVTRGSQLLAVFWDRRGGMDRLWFTSKQTAASPLPATPFPPTVSVQAAGPAQTALLTAPDVVPFAGNPTLGYTPRSAGALSPGALWPAAILVGAVVWIRARRARRP